MFQLPEEQFMLHCRSNMCEKLRLASYYVEVGAAGLAHQSCVAVACNPPVYIHIHFAHTSASLPSRVCSVTLVNCDLRYTDSVMKN